MEYISGSIGMFLSILCSEAVDLLCWCLLIAPSSAIKINFQLHPNILTEWKCFPIPPHTKTLKLTNIENF